MDHVAYHLLHWTPLPPPPVGPSVTQTGVFSWFGPHHTHTHTHTSFDGVNKFVSVHRWCERQKSWTGFMKTHRFMFYINIGGVSRLYWSRIYKWTKASMHPHAALRISLHMMRLWSIHVMWAATILISSRLLFFFLKTYIQECRQPIGKENECEKHLPPLTHSCRYIMILMFIAKANTSVCACDHARRNAPDSISLWNICTYLAESLTWGLVRDFRGIRQKGARFSYNNKSFSNFGASHHIATDKKIK